MQSTITDEISAVNNALAERIGNQKYKIWFQDSTKFMFSDGYCKIAVPNMFIANWIESHFINDINHAVKAATNQQHKVTFTIDSQLSGSKTSSLTSQKNPVELGRKFEQAARIKKSPQSRRLKLSLDNFVVGASNQLAYSAAKTVIEEEKSSFNPLFIHGGYGVGKTHLLQGICNGVADRRPKTDWLYLSAEDFANQFVLALKTKKLEAFRSRMRQTDLLAIDDIHFLASKPSTQEEFLHTFNSVDLAGKQIVLVSDAHPKMIGQLSEKLVNRFVSGMVVKIDAPDLQTRCNICRQFSDSLGHHLPESVIRYTAENVKNNVREIEGAILKLVAFSSLKNEKVSLNMAKDVLAEHLSRTDPIVHVSDIESAVATYFGITASDMHSSKKDRTIALARHFSMFLVRKHTNMSFPEVGRAMGNKNHATVIMACRKIEENINLNKDLQWNSSIGNRLVKAKKVLSEIESSIAD